MSGSIVLSFDDFFPLEIFSTIESMQYVLPQPSYDFLTYSTPASLLWGIIPLYYQTFIAGKTLFGLDQLTPKNEQIFSQVL